MAPRSTNATFYAVGATSVGAVTDAVASLTRQLRPCEPNVVLVFAYPTHDLQGLVDGLRQHLPDAVIAGCTTMGEIGPSGFTQGEIVALALGPPCRAAAVMVPELSRFRFEDGARLVSELAAQLDLEPSGLVPGRHALVTLTDGLSGMEEVLVASLGTCLPAVPLVGGSAGNGEQFQRTLVGLNGRVHAGAAVVLLLEPSVQLHAFQLHHYRPTAGRLVVTRAEPRRRVVSALNGRPAAQVLAELCGVPVERLRDGGPTEIARHGIQFGIRAGDLYYIRSVMTLQGDSLLLGGAVEEGAILTVMHAGDIVEATRQGVLSAQAALDGEVEVMLAFSCGGRFFEARDRGVLQELDAAIQPLACVGFTTYGEQFGPMQVNHTLTALMLGRPHGR